MSEKRKRSKVIQVRVSPEEKASFLERCKNAGLTTGDYIRVACLKQKPLRRVKRITLSQELITRFIGLLMRYGNNLNQIARKLNQLHNPAEEDMRAIHQGLAQIREMRNFLRKALGYDVRKT